MKTENLMERAELELMRKKYKGRSRDNLLSVIHYWTELAMQRGNDLSTALRQREDALRQHGNALYERDAAMNLAANFETQVSELRAEIHAAKVAQVTAEAKVRKLEKHRDTLLDILAKQS